ncbi:hypothetical protein Tco_1083843, partial [Tanacetum coccineum]
YTRGSIKQRRHLRSRGCEVECDTDAWRAREIGISIEATGAARSGEREGRCEVTRGGAVALIAISARSVRCISQRVSACIETELGSGVRSENIHLRELLDVPTLAACTGENDMCKTLIGDSHLDGGSLRLRADALRLRADALGRWANEYLRQAKACEERAKALGQRARAYNQRVKAFEARLRYFRQNYDIHHKFTT